MGLVVETEAPSGNACDVAVEEGGGMPAVSFAADPHGGPECLWFCFRLRQAGRQAASGGKVRLIFKHFNQKTVRTIVLPNPEKHPEQHAHAMRWVGLFSDALTPAYAAGRFGRVATYASRWETPTFTSYCCEGLGVCGITLEVPYAMSGDTLLTRERYREAGGRLAACVVREVIAGKA